MSGAAAHLTIINTGELRTAAPSLGFAALRLEIHVRARGCICNIVTVPSRPLMMCYEHPLQSCLPKTNEHFSCLRYMAKHREIILYVYIVIMVIRSRQRQFSKSH